MRDALRKLPTHVIMLPAAAALLVIGVSLAQPRFLSSANLFNVARQCSPLAIFALAQMIPLLTRGLDLSQGGIVVATSVSFALLSQQFGTPLAFVLAIGLGGVAGLVNGVMIASAVPPFVVTLGIGSVLQGLALLASNGQPISDVPSNFSKLFYGSVIGLPVPVAAVVLLFGLFAFLLTRTLLGRFVFAVGSNEDAAALCGIPVRLVKSGAYAVSGALTSFGGVLVASRISSGHPTVGSDTSLHAIGAAVLGGVSLFGGRGNVWGVLGGALFLGILGNALNVLNISSFVQQVVIGAAIILAVGLDTLRRRREVKDVPGKGDET